MSNTTSPELICRHCGHGVGMSDPHVLWSGHGYVHLKCFNDDHMRAKAAEKPSNPKDLIGSDKAPLHLWPASATIGGSLALLEGMLKYGRANWRAVGVRASIYADALDRHMKAWMEGEDIDPDSGLPHLWKAIACVAILIDASATGNMTDDRHYPGGVLKLLGEAGEHVKRLKAQYGDRAPKHYTIKDGPA